MDSEALQHILNIISPIFIMIGLGAALKAWNFITDDLAEGLNKLVFWVGIPVFLFYKIAAAEKSFADIINLYYVVMIGVAASVVTALVVAFLLKLDKPSKGAFLQGAFRGNILFIGLPLAVFTFADQGSGKIAEIEELVLLSISLLTPSFNLIAIFLVVSTTAKIDIAFPAKVLKRMIKNPIIISVLCGLAYAQLFDSIPLPVERSCRIIGQMTLPLAILSIGANIVASRGASDFNIAFLASVIKVVIGPAAGFAAIYFLFDMQYEQQVIAMLFLACPTAVSSFVIAEQLGANKNLAAAIIVVSSILAAGSTAGVLYLLQ
ncbi:auxin efflux carrier [Sedimentisphaera cyanobacteriorum]|uniref:Auxin efflux carrier n=1 Tax=Sedimentisphaera cyanobacteriorum TaxID=1940790 RepID=A0A1Q2HLD8_9BACT|nr:AEC family transporter [Sedimentisphaera cyanobacteriorum]AQQ08277.1 auxin efflux carrier [Sedimentisphaera cyanobacteriorum]